jgi:uncharacterized SAM-binding protein YcdF (DUF218 family)
LAKKVKVTKPKEKKGRFGRKSLFFVNFILLMIPVTYFGYQPLLRYSSAAIIVDSSPAQADAIVLLSGGEPGRAWGAADLYQQGLAPHVVLTREPPSIDDLELQRRGVQILTGLQSNLNILRGLGVPQEAILQVEPYVQDTFDELTRVRELAQEKGWNSIIIVTSNYHTRRSRLVARYVFGASINFTVAGSTHGGLDRNGWWNSRMQVRTFLIEFQKLVAYTLYIWPRLVF